MTTNKPHCAKPERDRPIKKATGGDQTSTATTQSAAQVVAIFVRLVGVTSGFYMSRGIGADTLAMLLALAIYLVVGVLA